MTPWYRNIMCGFDTETTGVDTRQDRIIQWGAVDLLPDGQARADVEYVNPGIPIPVGASGVHGITDEYVRQFGNPPAESTRRLAERLAASVKARIPIIGMNLSFDLALSHWESRRYGLPALWELCDGEPAPIIDVLVLDKQVDPYRRGRRNLAALCQHYGVPHGGAHEAVEDIKASARVGWVIASRYPEIGNADPLALHRSQKQWKAEQAASFQHYQRTKGGKPNAYIDPCWPACLDPTHPTDGMVPTP